jgi:SAM-dependent methyltransferase
MVEEVAQVRHHRTTLTGRLRDGHVPEALVRAIHGFKQAMLEIDQQLSRDQGRPAPLGQPRPELLAMAAERCDHLLCALREAVEGARDTQTADGYGGYALRETFGVLMQSRLADRAFSKPRGYAGDYYTIELIHENQPQGDGRLGPLIDAWVLSTPSARGVRAQRAQLVRLLRERLETRGAGQDGVYRVLSLGSGAGRELLDLLAGLRDGRRVAGVRATCLDVDMEALAFSNYLAHCAGFVDQFQWTKANVTQLCRGRADVRPAPQDVIYSAGLFDYLEDEVVIDLLDWIHDHLEPGGLVIVGNAERGCPDRALWEHLLDWRVRYRSAAELRGLLVRSRFAHSRIEVRREESRVSLFALAEK